MPRVTGAALVVVALTVSASVAIVVSNSAWATPSVTCHKLGGKATGKFHLKQCTPRMPERTLTGPGNDLATVGGPTTDTWTWNDGATTVVSLTVVRGGTCPAGYSAWTDTGTVIGGTSTNTQVGDSIAIAVCKKNPNRFGRRLQLAAGSSALL